MGERKGWEQVSLNGLVMDESADGNVARVLDQDRWTVAERRIAQLIECIQPNQPSNDRRNAVCAFGSAPLKTYLPDGDIDLTVLTGDNDVKETWANKVRHALECEEKNPNAEFNVKEVQIIQAEVKIIKCLVENIAVDISFNQAGGLCTLHFLEEADRLISHSHLFKSSIILIKAWCYYESCILGAHHGLISTYALETMVLYIFNIYNKKFAGPLEVLFRFLEFFSKFDWEKYCVSLWGPVPIISLPNMIVESPRRDDEELLLSKDLIHSCTLNFGASPGDQETRIFSSKFLNVIDPLRTSNNLGRSVSKVNFFKIRSAFVFGANKLAPLLECQKEEIITELNHFFRNTWERHGSGIRPDCPKELPNPTQIQKIPNIIKGNNITKNEDQKALKTNHSLNTITGVSRSRLQFARTRSSPDLTNPTNDSFSSEQHKKQTEPENCSSSSNNNTISLFDEIPMTFNDVCPHPSMGGGAFDTNSVVSNSYDNGFGFVSEEKMSSLEMSQEETMMSMHGSKAQFQLPAEHHLLLASDPALNAGFPIGGPVILDPSGQRVLGGPPIAFDILNYKHEMPNHPREEIISNQINRDFDSGYDNNPDLGPSVSPFRSANSEERNINKSDFLKGDLDRHLENLKYGRLCRDQLGSETSYLPISDSPPSGMDSICIPRRYRYPDPVENIGTAFNEGKRDMKKLFLAFMGLGVKHGKIVRNRRILYNFMQVYSIQFLDCSQENLDKVCGTIKVNEYEIFKRRMDNVTFHDIDPQGFARLKGPMVPLDVMSDILFYPKLFRENHPEDIFHPSRFYDLDEWGKPTSDDVIISPLDRLGIYGKHLSEQRLMEEDFNKLVSKKVHTKCGPVKVKYAIFYDAADSFLTVKLLEWYGEGSAANLYGTIRTFNTLLHDKRAKSLAFDLKRDEHLSVKAKQYIPMHRPGTVVPIGHKLRVQVEIFHKNKDSRENDKLIASGTRSFTARSLKEEISTDYEAQSNSTDCEEDRSLDDDRSIPTDCDEDREDQYMDYDVDCSSEDEDQFKPTDYDEDRSSLDYGQFKSTDEDRSSSDEDQFKSTDEDRSSLDDDQFKSTDEDQSVTDEGESVTDEDQSVTDEGESVTDEDHSGNEDQSVMDEDEDGAIITESHIINGDWGKIELKVYWMPCWCRTYYLDVDRTRPGPI